MSHARLAPSNHRWPHCPGSVREEASYPDTSSEASIDGTGSHILLELCLEHSCSASYFVGQIIGAGHEDKPKGWTVDEERAARVQMTLDYIERRKTELMAQFPLCKIVVESETHADPGGMFGRDDWYGTVDITILVLNPNGGLHFLEIVDLKDGRLYVDAHDNTQLISYCAGKMRPYVGSGPELVRPFRAERVGGCRTTIVQPKTNPPVRYVDYTGAEMVEKAEELAVAARATDDPDAPLCTGAWCLWCKANPKKGGHCTEGMDTQILKVENMSNDLQMYEYIQKAVADPTSIPNDKLAELADAKDALMAAFERVEAEIERRLDEGHAVPGYGFGNGRGSRVWNEDEETIVKKLKAKRLKQDEIFPKKLASPAQILDCKSLSDTQKRKIEEELVTFKAGKRKVKKIAHAKPEKDVQALFGDIQEDNTGGDNAPEIPSFM